MTIDESLWYPSLGLNVRPRRTHRQALAIFAIAKLINPIQSKAKVEVIKENSGVASEILAAAQAMSSTYHRDFDQDDIAATKSVAPLSDAAYAKHQQEKEKNFKPKEKRKRNQGQANRKLRPAHSSLSVLTFVAGD